MNMDHCEYFDKIVNSIIGSNLKSILETFSDEEIKELVHYLDHKLYFQLVEILKRNNTSTSWIDSLNQLTHYQTICSSQNIDLLKVMFVSKMTLMKAGTQKHSNKNIIMQGINVTLRSIINRQFDMDRIDNNLRLGAKERKEHIKKGHHKIKKNHDSLFDEHTPIQLSKKQHTTSEITSDPTGKKKIVHYQHHHIIKMNPSTTINNYQEGVKVLNEMDFNNPLDTPLSHPLDEPPVGKSGSTLIVPGDESIIKKQIQQTPEKHTSFDLDPNSNITNETLTKSFKIQTIKMPPEKIYNEVPFIK